MAARRHLLGRRILTNVGVQAIAHAFLGSFDLSTFAHGDVGTGTNAESVSDTTLQTPYGGIRWTGTQSVPSNGVYQCVVTVTFAGTFAITEFGLFSAASAGTLLDRFVFDPLNVKSGDSLQFTFTLTFAPGH